MLIEFLLRAEKVAAVNIAGAGGAVIAVGIVVRRIAVVKTVGDNLVNALRLSETVGGGLSPRSEMEKAKQRDSDKNHASRRRSLAGKKEDFQRRLTSTRLLN